MRLGLAAAAVVVTLAAAAPALAKAPGEPACSTRTVRQHDQAVFGHYASTAAARRVERAAARLGFKGLKIENEGCGAWALEIDGADTQQQRTSFAAEAGKAGYIVTYMQDAPPMQFQSGFVVGVFGSFKTIGAANAYMTRIAKVGFRFLEPVPTANGHWLVVMPQVPVKKALSIAKEAASAGFHVQFRPGAKT